MKVVVLWLMKLWKQVTRTINCLKMTSSISLQDQDSLAHKEQSIWSLRTSVTKLVITSSDLECSPTLCLSQRLRKLIFRSRFSTVKSWVSVQTSLPWQASSWALVKRSNFSSQNTLRSLSATLKSATLWHFLRKTMDQKKSQSSIYQKKV